MQGPTRAGQVSSGARTVVLYRKRVAALCASSVRHCGPDRVDKSERASAQGCILHGAGAGALLPAAVYLLPPVYGTGQAL